MYYYIMKSVLFFKEKIFSDYRKKKLYGLTLVWWKTYQKSNK